MKVAIVTPVHSDPKFGYTQSLAHMLIYSLGRGVEIGYFTRRGTVVSAQRNILASWALDWGADYVLWIDSDQTFPCETLERLLNHRKQIVGCNIARRDDPTGPTAARLVGGKMLPVWTTGPLAKAKTVEEVSAMGMGLCLIAAEVLQAIEAPQFRTETEDFYFFGEARKAGFPIHLDHGLSWEVGHVTETVLTNLHTIADKARWNLVRSKGAKDVDSVHAPAGAK